MGIIGVVAAMTMPALIQKNQDRVTVTKLKKAYSVISQAYMMARNEYGDINNWGFAGNSDSSTMDPDTGMFDDIVYNNSELFWSKLVPYMKVISTCYSKGSNCKVKNQYYLNGSIKNLSGSITQIKLNDGIVFENGWIGNINCTTGACGNFSVDINGPDTPPNTVGKDIFYFSTMKDRIIPNGTQTARDGITFDNRCKASGSDGYGCAAWVIYNENMDYLKCPNELSWDGKTKCSD